MTEERPAEREFNLRMGGFLVAVALSPIYGLFAHYDQEDRGLLVVLSLAVICTVGYVRRERLRSVVFRSVLAALCIAQIALALVVPIPAAYPYPGYTLVPLAFLDLAIVLGVMSFVDRRFCSPQV